MKKEKTIDIEKWLAELEDKEEELDMYTDAYDGEGPIISDSAFDDIASKYCRELFDLMRHLNNIAKDIVDMASHYDKYSIEITDYEELYTWGKMHGGIPINEETVNALEIIKKHQQGKQDERRKPKRNNFSRRY